MHAPSLTSPARSLAEGQAARQAGRAFLADALRASRADTLATFAVCAAALGSADIPVHATLNPPLWELGHLGWFQEYWIARNPERDRGARADPEAPRLPGVRPGADALYDSSRVAQPTRRALPLPDAAATHADLERQLDATLAWLDRAPDTPEALYFFRLALLHEDMHHEAALYMARALGIAIDDARWQSRRVAGDRRPLAFSAGRWCLGSTPDEGFAFDNELGAHAVDLGATRIDSRVLTWAEYLPFVDDPGGHADPAHWGAAGRAWRAAQPDAAPRYLRRVPGGGWAQRRPGGGSAVDLGEPACHLSAFEAEAWCRWAGRRLPTEAEWERAAVTRPGDFVWGEVWEWTASDFLPYPGFAAHPYRDYSAPWFGDRRVLRGASFMTQARMRHPRYRNFFGPDRNDVAAGFRTCER